MDRIFEQKGFSLTEVLLSLGILTVAMLFIAGVFPVGIHYATVSTDRTMAAVVADEAFAKLRLYDFQPTAALEYIHPGDPAFTFSRDVNDVCKVAWPEYWDDSARGWRRYEYFYPSITYYTDGPEPRYTWAAILRQLGPDPKQIQATVFVCRYLGPNAEYYGRFPLGHSIGVPGELDFNVLHLQPMPVFVWVRQPLSILNSDELIILPSDSIEEKRFINDGCTIVDDETGQIYRVLERYGDDPGTVTIAEDHIIRLDRPFVQGTTYVPPELKGKVWVIPPRVDKTQIGITDPPPIGKSPCVAVYQRIIRF